MVETLEEYKEYIRNRLEPISEILANIAAGDFSKKLDIPPSEDEFSELYVGFDFMMEDLLEHLKEREEAEAELKKHQEKLEEIVKHRTEELTEINKKLKQEIKEHEKDKRELQEIEAKYKLIYDNMSDVVFTADPTFTLTFVSPSVEKFAGYKPEEWVGKKFGELTLLSPESLKESFKNFQDYIAGGKPIFHEYEFKTKDGQTRIAEVNSTLIFKNGKFIELVSMARDITERKQAEERLRESEEKYRNLVENINDVIYQLDNNGFITYVSPMVKTIIGYDPSDIIGQKFDRFFFKEDLPILMENFKKLLTGASLESEYRILTKSGKVRWIHTSSRPMVVDGKITGIHGVLSDISERKRTVDALKESEELYKSLIRASPEAVTATDLEGKIIFASPQTIKLYYYDNQDELLGRNAFEMIDPKDHERAMKNLKITLEKGFVRNLEYTMLKKNGSSFIGELNAALIKDAEGKPKSFIAAVRDITKRKGAEGRLRKALEEKDILLREVHHRVKNNIQVITSMLSLHSKYIKDQQYSEMIQEIQNRIRSMALIHEKLYKSEDISFVNFNDYIKELVNELFRSYGANVAVIKPEISVQNVLLGIDDGIPCGLIINELVSNSLKHGFSGYDSGGKISIELTSSGEKKIILKVSDTGVGFPNELDFKNSNSFGLRLVNTLVEQLGGEINLQRGEGGTKFNISFEKSSSK
jgi:PAS domain S-box-containing protein